MGTVIKIIALLEDSESEPKTGYPSTNSVEKVPPNEDSSKRKIKPLIFLGKSFIPMPKQEKLKTSLRHLAVSDDILGFRK